MGKKADSSIHGIRIKSMAQTCIVICALLMIVTYVGLTRVDESYKKLIKNTNACLEGEKCAISLEESSDYLTDQVRLFVISRNPDNMYHYFEEIDGQNRENMVQRLRELYEDTDPKTVDQLEKALHESHNLEEKEVHAMRLLSYQLGIDEDELPAPVAAWNLTEQEEELSEEELIKEAYKLVYGTEYLEDKQKIESNIAKTLHLLTQQMELRQKDSERALTRTLIQQKIVIFLMMALVCIVFCLAGILIVYPVSEHVRSIQTNQKWKHIGGYEIQYLADIYNRLYDKNEVYKEQLEYKADHDALTGLCNREAFEKQKDFLRGKKIDMALLLADVDDFKTVNDMHGHDVGDVTLKKVADVLTHLGLKECYFVARIGGDEFVVILLDIKPEMFPIIEAEIEKVNDIIGTGDENTPPISLSVGVSFSEQGYSHELFRQADHALYYTKKHGRRGCSVYTKEMVV